MTHAVLSMSCRAGSDSLSSRSERLHNAHANQLPKQQLPADGSVFLIRLLQLWMVHSKAARHPPANAAYHTLAGEEKEERVEEEGRRGKRRGKGMKALKKNVVMNVKRGQEAIKKGKGKKGKKRGSFM